MPIDIDLSHYTRNNTCGYGNCGFHALLGQFDPARNEYHSEFASSARERVSAAIRRCIDTESDFAKRLISCIETRIESGDF